LVLKEVAGPDIDESKVAAVFEQLPKLTRDSLRSSMASVIQGVSFSDASAQMNAALFKEHKTDDESLQFGLALAADWIARRPAIDPDAYEACGIRVSSTDMEAALEIQKLGVRVEQTVPGRTEDEAWVVASGFNLDGSSWRCSTLMIRQDGDWLSVSVPSVEATAARPEGVPRPAQSEAVMRARMAKELRSTMRMAFAQLLDQKQAEALPSSKP
jgi:hypothetical protein